MKPTTLIEAMQELDRVFPAEDKAAFMESSESKAIGLSHHSTGRWIRNEWKLWEAGSDLSLWFAKRGIEHADDMSGIIMTSYYRKLNCLPIDLPGQIQKYKDYWAKEELNEDNEFDLVPSQAEQPTGKPTRRSTKAFSADNYKLGDKPCTEE